LVKEFFLKKDRAVISHRLSSERGLDSSPLRIHSCFEQH
jgi:hypothetical protein